MAITTLPKPDFSISAFIKGLVGVAIICSLFVFYALYQQPTTIKTLESRLAEQTIFIASTKDSSPQPLKKNDHAAPDKKQDDSKSLSVSLENASLEEDLTSLIDKKNQSLTPAPVKTLTEETEYGFIPKKDAATGKSAFNAYKKPFLLNKNKPIITVSILNFGLSEDISKNILAFAPAEVSLILSPYAKEPEKWQKMAREDGHELWLNTHFQTQSFPTSDPGSHAFLANLSFSANRDKLYWLLSRTQGYAGIAAFTDASFSDGGAVFKKLIDESFNRGLGFFELNPQAQNYVAQAANESAHPYVTNSLTIKNLDPNSPERAQAEKILAENKHVSMTISPTAKNLVDLKTWINQLQRSGVQIAPISAMAQAQ